MAKNFASIFARTGDSIALEQKFFLVKETSKGTLIGPTAADFLYTKQGGSVNHTQPKVSSEHRSGRHNTDIYLEKKKTEWTLPMFININVGVGAGTTEVDTSVRLLWESLLGKETVSSGLIYDASVDPDITFSLFENGDKWAQQCYAAFPEEAEISLPGDGVAGVQFKGRCANRHRVGIGKSVVDNSGGNTVELTTPAHAKRFPVGALVMLVKSDGVTRSTDTATGTYRKVTARDTTTGIVTLSGAALADADGTAGTGIYLCYAEPASPTGIANIQTGLKGSVSVDGLGGTLGLVRSAKVTLKNNHEVVDYGYGTDELAPPYFIPGGRLDVAVEIEINLNDNVIQFLDDLDAFEAQAINLFLGNTATRHFKIELGKVFFDVPSTSLPQNGSIPVTLSGTGFQSALDAADEVKVKYL
jgi:hypothetical protein